MADSHRDFCESSEKKMKSMPYCANYTVQRLRDVSKA